MFLTLVTVELRHNPYCMIELPHLIHGVEPSYISAEVMIGTYRLMTTRTETCSATIILVVEEVY